MHWLKNADGCEDERMHGLGSVDRFASVLGLTRIKFSCWGEDSLSCVLGDFGFSAECQSNAAIPITSTVGKIATGFFSAAFHVSVVWGGIRETGEWAIAGEMATSWKEEGWGGECWVYRIFWRQDLMIIVNMACFTFALRCNAATRNDRPHGRIGVIGRAFIVVLHMVATW